MTNGRRALIAVTPIGAEVFTRSLPPALADRFDLHVVDLPGTCRPMARGRAQLDVVK